MKLSTFRFRAARQAVNFHWVVVHERPRADLILIFTGSSQVIFPSIIMHVYEKHISLEVVGHDLFDRGDISYYSIGSKAGRRFLES